MDPLSISASLATLLSFADTVSKGLGKFLALKHAPQVLQRLNDELSDFHFAIAAIEDVYRQQEALPNEQYSNQRFLSEAIRRAKEAILDLEKMVTYGLLKAPNRKDPKIDKTFWLRNEGKVREMRQLLQHTKTDILIALKLDEMQAFSLRRGNHNANTWLLRQWRTSLHCLLVQLVISNERLSSQHQALEEMCRRAIQRPQLHREHPSSESTLRPASEVQQLAVSSVHPMAPIEVENICAQSIRSKTPRYPMNISFCPCVCHKKKYLKSPTFINQIFGSLFIGYNTLPFGNTSCGSHCCKRDAVPTIDVSYIFPVWLLDRIVSVKMCSSGLDLRLRVLRVRSNDSEIFSAVAYHDTSKVRDMLADGRASVLDVNEEGESLLTVSGLAFAGTHIMIIVADCSYSGDWAYNGECGGRVLRCIGKLWRRYVSTRH